MNKTLKTEMTPDKKDYVVVTCISSHRMRYVMHKDDLQKLNPDDPCNPITWAEDTVSMEDCEEFSQEYMGEYIVDSTLVTEEEMLDLFDKDNAYLSEWSTDHKINWVRSKVNSLHKYYKERDKLETKILERNNP